MPEQILMQLTEYINDMLSFGIIQAIITTTIEIEIILILALFIIHLIVKFFK